MSATARLVVMMDPEDKRTLIANAKAQNVSVAKLARERLLGTAAPDEQIFLEAVANLGQRARHIFADVDARQAREAAARAEQPAHEAAIRVKVEAAFAAARAQDERSRGKGRVRGGGAGA